MDKLETEKHGKIFQTVRFNYFTHFCYFTTCTEYDGNVDQPTCKVGELSKGQSENEMCGFF